MEIKKLVRDRSVFVDVTPVPGGNGKKYNIFVFKKNFEHVCNVCKAIANKVSKRSEFRDVAKKLSDKKNWTVGKPKNVSGYKEDNKKYFLELKVKEISVLRDMIYEYKSKFRGGTLIMGDSVLQKSGTIQTAILSVISGLKKQKSGNSTEMHENELSEKLNIAKNKRIDEKQREFKDLVEKNFRKYDDKIEHKNKKVLEVLNPLLRNEDKIKYSDVDFKISEGVARSEAIINDMDRKKKLYPKKYDEKTGKQIEKILDRWIQSIGSKMMYGARSYIKVGEYLRKGYRIMSVLGTGGSAVVVKFLDDKGKEKALKIFYDKSNGYDYEIDAIKSMKEKLGAKRLISRKESEMKRYFNAPKIRKDGELEMKLANKVLDSKEFIRRGGKPSDLTIGFFEKMACDILKGLRKLHAAGKVHGDIKPDNIHIMEGGRFKIADVGTVCNAGDGFINTGMYTHPDWLNREHGVEITPEQKQKNDVYALGCAMLDVLCGKRVKRYIGFNVSYSKIAEHFTDESMKNKYNVSELLKFINKLCAKKLDDVPTASEALKSSFVVKAGN